MKQLFIILGIVFVVAAVVNQNDDTASTTAPVEYEVTADDVVDALPTTTVQDFCGAYTVVGEAGYPTFAAEYTNPEPTAREVFNELASRC